MRIERRTPRPGQSPYHPSPSGAPRARSATRTARSSSGSTTSRCPRRWSQVASDVLAQKYFRKAGVPARLKKVEENGVPSWLWRSVPDEAALAELPEEQRYGSEISAKQVFDRLAGCWTYWGWKGGYFSTEEDARAFYDELRFMLATQMVRAELAAMVQHRPALGLRHRRPGQGHYYVDHQTGELTTSDLGLRAPAAARLLHPVRRGRPRQRGRHHGPVGARGAPVQVRLRHRLQLLAPARRGREAVRRRPVVRPDELPQDRRPRRRRHQVGRHHAPRRQDGGGRRRPPRHRGLHRLEGEGGAEGRRPRHRLQDLPQAPQGDHEGLRQLRGRGRRLLRSRTRTRR